MPRTLTITEGRRPVARPPSTRVDPGGRPVPRGTFSLFPTLDPEEEERLRREKEVRESTYNQAISKALKGDFVPDEGLDDIWFRMGLARVQTVGEKAAKFKSSFPEGTLGLVLLPDDEFSLVFKTDPSQPYREVSPQFKWTTGDIGNILGSVVSEPVVGAVMGSAAMPIIGTAVGFFAGTQVQSAQQQVEELITGVPLEQESFGAVVGRGAVGGAIFAGIEAVPLAAGLAKRVAPVLADIGRSRSIAPAFRPFPKAPEVAGAAERLGVEPPLFGQLVENPTIGAVFTQSGGMVSKPAREVTKQEQSLLTTLTEKGRTEGLEALSDVEIESLVRVQARSVEAVRPQVAPVSPEAAGRGVQVGLLEDFKNTSRVWVDRKYGNALRRTGKLVYDVHAPQRLAREIDVGTLAAGEGMFKVTLADGPARAATAEEIRFLADSVDISLLGKEGIHKLTVPNKLVGKGVTGATLTVPPVRVSQTPRGELAGVILTLRKMNPRVAEFKSKEGTFTAFEIMKDLRRRLFDLMGSSDEFMRREATRLWQSLSKSMDQPLGATKPFVQAYKAASLANRFRENILRKDFIRKFLRESTPEDIARRFFKPGNFTELQTMGRLVGAERFTALKDAFKLDLLAKPEEIVGRLKAFRSDERSLGLLMTQNERAAFEAYGSALARYDTSFMKLIADKHLTSGERGLAFVEKASEADVQQLIALSGGKDSPVAELLRRTIYNKLQVGATRISGTGESIVDRSSLEGLITTMLTGGMRKKLEHIFRPSDWATFKDLDLYTTIIAGTRPDVGGLMVRGQVASSLSQPIRPAGFISANIRLFSAWVASAILSKPATTEVLKRALRMKPGSARRVRMLTVAVAAARNDLLKNQNVGQRLDDLVNQVERGVIILTR